MYNVGIYKCICTRQRLAFLPVSKVLAYKLYVSDNVQIMYISLVMLAVYELNRPLHKAKNEHKSPTKTHGG